MAHAPRPPFTGNHRLPRSTATLPHTRPATQRPRHPTRPTSAPRHQHQRLVRTIKRLLRPAPPHLHHPGRHPPHPPARPPPPPSHHRRPANPQRRPQPHHHRLRSPLVWARRPPPPPAPRSRQHHLHLPRLRALRLHSSGSHLDRPHRPTPAQRPLPLHPREHSKKPRP